MCDLSCTSIRSLCEHVIGVKHKSLLTRLDPAKLRELGRLQYFLDSYLKEEPILGLEYVVERQVESSYLYTCLLCSVECEWRKMVAHVTDVDHTESYIYKHHSDMICASSDLMREEQVRALEEAAQAVYDKFGRKEIRIQKPDSDLPLLLADSPAKESGEKNAASDDTSAMTTCRRETDTDPPNYDCGLCDVKCASPVALCEHIQGNKHKMNLKCTAPQEMKDLGRLGYFLHTHWKDDPIIGLEYIVETVLGPSYKYSCQLCNVDTDLLKIVVHLMDVDHMDRYIKKHHGHLLPSVPKFTKKVVYLKTLREVAVKIVEGHGRRDIQSKNTTSGTPTRTFEGGDSLPFKQHGGNSSHVKKRPLPYQETGWDESYESYSYQKMFKRF